MTLSKYHYDTFLQRIHSILADKENVVPDQQLPSGSTKQYSMCKPLYIFSSKTDEERHMIWVHHSDASSNNKRKHSSSKKSRSISESRQRSTRRRELFPEY